MLSFIRIYFLRMYAIERRKGTKDERASYKEALFQARLLVFVPAVCLAGAVLTSAGRLLSWAQPMLADEYRAFTTALGVICGFIASFALVGRAIRPLEDISALGEAYSSDRDRLISHVSFWVTALSSLSFAFFFGAALHSAS